MASSKKVDKKRVELEERLDAMQACLQMLPMGEGWWVCAEYVDGIRCELRDYMISKYGEEGRAEYYADNR